MSPAPHDPPGRAKPGIDGANPGIDEPASLRRRAALGLVGTATLTAVAADRLKQFALVSLVGAAAPGSSVELLLLYLAMQVPMLALAPVAGVVLDHVSRPWAMTASCVARAAVVALLPAACGAPPAIAAVLAMTALLAALDLFFVPARSALLPQLVRDDDLLSANAAIWVLGIVGTFAGILAGGWLFDVHSWAAPFHGAGAVYAAAAVVSLALALVVPHTPRAATAAEAARAFPSAVADALRLFRSNRAFAVGLGTQTGVFAVGGVVAVIAVARVQMSVDIGRATLLSIVAASLVGGLIVGSMLPSLFRATARVGLVVAVACLAGGVALAGLGRTEDVVPVSIWAAILGLCVSPVFVVTETLLQRAAPESFRGRLFAAREALVKSVYLVAAGVAVGLDALFDKGTILVGLGVVLALLGVVIERTDILDRDIQTKGTHAP